MSGPSRPGLPGGADAAAGPAPVVVGSGARGRAGVAVLGRDGVLHVTRQGSRRAVPVDLWCAEAVIQRRDPAGGVVLEVADRGAVTTVAFPAGSALGAEVLAVLAEIAGPPDA